MRQEMRKVVAVVAAMAVGLKGLPKAEVFKVWTQVCLGRVHNAKMGEQRKDWMIYDIIRMRYNKEMANQVDFLI